MRTKRVFHSARRGFTLIELMIVLAIVGILVMFAVPQYQNYVIKTQVTRGMGEAGALRVVVDNCVLEGKTAIGTEATQCDPGASASTILQGASQGNAPAVTAGVNGYPQVNLGSAESASPATIVATFGNSAAQALQGQNVTWTRDKDSGAWTCATNVSQKYAPAGCTASSSGP
jgi:type IV pilus assembly protein PilA